MLSLENRSKMYLDSVKGLSVVASKGLKIACKSTTSDLVVKVIPHLIF